jgi:tRNA-2-methylthio-N6-dimethylallyladenosine synthase
MVNEINGIERIRFVTSHPRDLSPGLIDALRDLPKVCESLHLPVQSGADRVLKAMNRRYTRADYVDSVGRLREAVSALSLTTDIIVGFPGETEEDFEATMNLLKQIEFDGIFAFKYSMRPGTAAVSLPDHVDEAIREARLERVLEFQKEISIRTNRTFKGTKQEVLVDGHSKRGGMLSGRTRGNKVVNFTGPDSLIGALVSVHITDTLVNSLTGTLCE